MRKRFSHEHLLDFLRDSEPEHYRNFLRMEGKSFDYLLELVRPDIEKKDTNVREAIPASQTVYHTEVPSLWHRARRAQIHLRHCSSDCGVQHIGNLLSNHEGIEGKFR